MGTDTSFKRKPARPMCVCVTEKEGERERDA